MCVHVPGFGLCGWLLFYKSCSGARSLLLERLMLICVLCSLISAAILNTFQTSQWPWNQINTGWIKAFRFLHHTIRCKNSCCFHMLQLRKLEFLYAMIMFRKILGSNYFLCTRFLILMAVCEKLPFMLENEFLILYFHFFCCLILFPSKFNIRTFALFQIRDRTYGFLK